MTRRARVAVLGGTFDRFHIGHQGLLDAAFAHADRVGVGVTTDDYLRAHRKPLAGAIAPYARRRASVVRFLADRYARRRWWVVPLQDAWGRSVDRGVEVLIVSPDTAAGGRGVNRERRRRGLRPVTLVTVPLRLGDDLVAVSSRAIRAGRVSRRGHRRVPVRFAVDMEAGGARKAIARAIRAEFPDARVRWFRDRGPPTAIGRRMPWWDFRIGRASGAGPALALVDRAGNGARLGPPGPRGEGAGAALRRELGRRRKAFSGQLRSGKSWRRTFGSRSIAREPGRPRSRTG